MALCCGQTTAGTEGTRAATAHARLHAGKRDTKAASSVGQAEPAPTRGTSPTKHKLVPVHSHLSPIVRLSHRSCAFPRPSHSPRGGATFHSTFNLRE
ncbi:unnamed protein product [Parnassius apollo]|uniref:(apollo) hypothetical protein n=1 Tax=Parnassius apollo TaxID=110799 RepID=A0A8S3XN90_PARAO|nr:unnamed protein product [Parnassius apollo]